MIIDYQLLFYMYATVFLLILIGGLNDRFTPENKVLKTYNWSLTPAIIVLSFSLSGWVIKSFWFQIPILKKYEYNPFTWDIVALFWFLLILIITYLILRYIYSVSISDAFNLKLNQLPFILKVCAVLTAVNILSINLLDLNLLLTPQETDLRILKSMDTRAFILYSFVTVIIAPIAEESLFRGLIYSPLYRKVGRCLAIILSSLIWTHSHFYPLLPSIGVFITGLILGWLYDRSGSLVHPIVFHMFRNSWILVYYLT